MSILVEGQRFERYRVLRLLGSGVTGESYEVENLVLQQKATLKLIHSWATLAEAARRQFFREMQGICRLRHPYLAEVVDYGEIDAQLYVARRYVSSGSLLGNEGRLWFRPPLPVAEAIQYACQLARTLDYIHQQGYIHGALTLSNILVLRGANVEHDPDHAPFLLADVGLAHFVRRFGQPKISLLPLTAAPEQLGGRLTPASDQFALAAILYLWLAGRPPYLGSPEEIEHLKLTETIAPLASFNPAVTFEQEGIVRRALAVYPEDRYPSLSAFASALAATLTPPSYSMPTQPEPEPVADVARDIAPQTIIESAQESSTETTPATGPISADANDAEPLSAVEPAETPQAPERVEIVETVIDHSTASVAEPSAISEAIPTPVLTERDSSSEPTDTPVLAEHDMTTEPAATPVLVTADTISEPATQPAEVESSIVPAATSAQAEADADVEPAPTPVLAEHDTTIEPVATPVLAERDTTAEPLATPVLQNATTPDAESEKPEPEPAPDIISPIPEPEQPPEPLPAPTPVPTPQPVSPTPAPPAEPEPVTEPLPQPAPDIFSPIPEPEQAPQGTASALEEAATPQEQCEQKAVAHLLILSPFTGTTSKVVLEGDELTIGRAGSSDILLDFDDKTSRHHALLRREDGLYVLYDRQSANGVFVNGQRIPVETDIGCPLSNGDRIQIGNYELRFFVEASAENLSHSPLVSP